MDCDSIISSIKTEDLINDLPKLQEEKDMFDFNKNGNKTTDVVGIFEIETTDTITEDEVKY